MWYLDLCLYKACFVRKNFPHKSQLWPWEGKCIDSRWFLAADLSWQCFPHSQHKYPVPDFSMKLSRLASQSVTSIPRKKTEVIPKKSRIFNLDLFVISIFMSVQSMLSFHKFATKFTIMALRREMNGFQMISSARFSLKFFATFTASIHGARLLNEIINVCFPITGWYNKHTWNKN